MPVELKRAYDPPDPGDGNRYLVERLWPRGVKKDALSLKAWLKELAPSTELRRWYNHDPERWPEFTRRYREELANSGAQDTLERIAEEARRETVTLVFSTREVEWSGAKFLASVIEELASKRPSGTGERKKRSPTMEGPEG